jgi:hypothetical protein
MANSGSFSWNYPRGGVDEHGQTSPGYEALRGALGRLTSSLPSGITGTPNVTNVTPTRLDLPLTSAEKAHSRTESVFLQNFRTGSPAEANANNHSSVAVGSGQEGGRSAVRRSYVADLERKDRQALLLPDPAFDDLLNRLTLARDRIGREEHEGFSESRDHVPSGTLRYLPSSHPHHQEPTGDVPARFQPGRESLSVVRNITVRDSKRTKTRTRDNDYKRRVSISSSIGVESADRSHAESAVPYQASRFGQRTPALGDFGASPSPRPVSGGGGSHHETPLSEQSRHLFEEGPSPVLPPGGGRDSNSVGGISPSGKFEITLSH